MSMSVRLGTLGDAILKWMGAASTIFFTLAMWRCGGAARHRSHVAPTPCAPPRNLRAMSRDNTHRVTCVSSSISRMISWKS